MFKNLKYKNPNKYLIKKDLFIRNFKKLYQKIDDPWNQHKNFFEEESVIILKSFIEKFSNKKKKI